MQIGTVLYANVYNGRGDVVKTKQIGSSTEESYLYDAFGVNKSSSSYTIPNPFRYSGEYTDTETGKQYLRARYYDPSIGRFTQEDTYWGDGTNLYTYCHNNPVMFSDPSGHFDVRTFYTGFSYDSTKKIYYSKIDSWQRSAGFCDAYDAAAQLHQSTKWNILKIYFRYGDKNWRIELWKGQYPWVLKSSKGVATGAEIGLYYRQDWKIYAPYWYQSADNNNMMEMSFTLKKNNNVMFSRKSSEYEDKKYNGKHWWLTGFSPDNSTTNPKQLTMVVSITFFNRDMLKAFCKSGGFTLPSSGSKWEYSWT